MKRKGLENILGNVVLILAIAGLTALLVGWFSGFISEMQDRGSIQANEDRGRVTEGFAIDTFDGTHLILRNIGITDIILTKDNNAIISIYKDNAYQTGLIWEVKNDAGAWIPVGTDTMLPPNRLMRVSGPSLFQLQSNYQVKTEKEVMLIFGQGVPALLAVTANPSRIPANDGKPETHNDESRIVAIIADMFGNPIAGQTVDFTIIEPNDPSDVFLSSPSAITDAAGAASVILQGNHDMTVRVRAVLHSDTSVRGEVRVVIAGTTIIKRDVRAVSYSYGTSSSCSNPTESISKMYMKDNGSVTATKAYCDERVRGAHNRYVMFEVDLRGTTKEIPKDAIIMSVTFNFRHEDSFYATLGSANRNCNGSLSEGINQSQAGTMHNGLYSTLWWQDGTVWRPMGYPMGPGYYNGTGAYTTNRYGWYFTSPCSINNMWSYVEDLDDRLNDDVWIFYLDHSINPHDASNPNTVNGVVKEDNIVNYVYLGNMAPVRHSELPASIIVPNLQFMNPYGVTSSPPDIINYINTPQDANHFALGVYFENNLVQDPVPGVIKINYVVVTITYRMPGAMTLSGAMVL